MPDLLSRLGDTLFLASRLRGQSRVPYWPLERLQARQAERLRRVVRHAYRYVPYYRETMRRLGLTPDDLRSAADLEKLPLLSGAELARDPQSFRSERVPRGQTAEQSSSGTSGHRKLVAHDFRSLLLGWAESQRRRDVVSALVDVRHGARVLMFNLPGGSIELQANLLRTRTFVPRRFAAARRSLPPTLTVEECRAAVNEFRPDIVHGYGSFLGHLFREVHRRGLEIHRPRLLIRHSDAMAEADRRLIEETLGIPLVSFYVANETMFIAFQCELGRGYHIDVDRVAVRVVDGEGRTVGPGVPGEIVVSNLTNLATVVLNYKLGDVVTLAAGPCPCGRTLPLIERLEGRSDETIVRADGTLVPAVAVLSGHDVPPEVVRSQLRQEATDRFRVLVVTTPDADRAAVTEVLTREVRARAGTDVDVTVEYVTAIPPDAGGKVRAVVRAFQGSEPG